MSMHPEKEWFKMTVLFLFKEAVMPGATVYVRDLLVRAPSARPQALSVGMYAIGVRTRNVVGAGPALMVKLVG